MSNVAVIYKIFDKHKSLRSELARRLKESHSIDLLEKRDGAPAGPRVLVWLCHAGLSDQRKEYSHPDLTEGLLGLRVHVSSSPGNGIAKPYAQANNLLDLCLDVGIGKKDSALGSNEPIDRVCTAICKVVGEVIDALKQESGASTSSLMNLVKDRINASADSSRLLAHLKPTPADGGGSGSAAATGLDPGSLGWDLHGRVQTPLSYIPGRLRHSWIANELGLLGPRAKAGQCSRDEFVALATRSKAYLELLDCYVDGFGTAHCLACVDADWPEGVAEKLKEAYPCQYQAMAGRTLDDDKKTLQDAADAARAAAEAQVPEEAREQLEWWENLKQAASELDQVLERLPVQTGVLWPQKRAGS